MKKVLIIAYAFPPVGGSGVQRPVKFIKYLREFGWEPMVLTVENPSVPLIDKSLLKDIPPGAKIYRARSLEPSYAAKKALASTRPGRLSFKAALKKVISFLLLPDIHVLWWPGLFRKLWSILRTERPACLCVTAPPFSSFIPVVFLARVLRVPVVIDFRDEWTFSRQQWENTPRNSFAFRVDRILENFVLSRCTDFTAVTASYVDALRERYPAACRGKGHVVTNGYDEDDFNDIHEQRHTDDLLTMVYAGTVWNGNSLENFAAALKRFISLMPEQARRLRVKIFGRVVDQHRNYLADPAFADIVHLYGYLDHASVIHEVCAADVLLLAISKVPEAERIIVGKVFEYMASGRHIFAVVPEGETKAVLKDNYNKLSFADSGSPDEILAGLTWIMTNRATIRDTVPVGVAQFSRRKLANRLKDILENVSGQAGTDSFPVGTYTQDSPIPRS